MILLHPREFCIWDSIQLSVFMKLQIIIFFFLKNKTSYCRQNDPSGTSKDKTTNTDFPKGQ